MRAFFLGHIPLIPCNYRFPPHILPSAASHSLSDAHANGRSQPPLRRRASLCRQVCSPQSMLPIPSSLNPVTLKHTYLTQFSTARSPIVKCALLSRLSVTYHLLPLQVSAHPIVLLVSAAHCSGSKRVWMVVSSECSQPIPPSLVRLFSAIL